MAMTMKRKGESRGGRYVDVRDDDDDDENEHYSVNSGSVAPLLSCHTIPYNMNRRIDYLKHKYKDVVYKLDWLAVYRIRKGYNAPRIVCVPFTFKWVLVLRRTRISDYIDCVTLL